MNVPVDTVFDVAIVGGGIHGVAIARDCAMRRFSVALFEKEDLGSGGSSRWSGLLNGSSSYLDSEGEEARRRSDDGGALGRIAPNLLSRVPTLIPWLEGETRERVEKIQSFARAYDRYARQKNIPGTMTLAADALATLDPGFSRRLKGAIAVDEWGVDVERLVVLTAKSAAMAGAQIFTRTQVESIELQKGAVVGLNVTALGHQKTLVRARTVVNACGPWPFSKGVPPGPKVRLSKGITLAFERRLSNLALALAGPDGEGTLFLMPFGHSTLLGTTQSAFRGNPEAVGVSQEEVRGILEQAKRFFPSINDYRCLRATAGVRVSLEPDEKGEIPEYVVEDYSKQGADGYFTVTGGKFALHRQIAEEATDLLGKKLHKKETCRTHLEALPGCTLEQPWREESRRTGFDPLTVRRLMYRHGHKALEILESARKNPELAQTLCECEQVLAAEVEYCVREEWARDIEDVRRRTHLGAGPCRGCRCATGTAAFLASVFRWSANDEKEHADRFLNARALESAPVLFGEQVKQEEYARALCLMGAPIAPLVSRPDPRPPVRKEPWEEKVGKPRERR